jgi:2'-5' RNA ligase
MRGVDCYRYFVGFRPSPVARAGLRSLSAPTGQHRAAEELLHLTLFVIAETALREHFLLSRVDAALAGQALSAPVVRLGRVRGGPGGALVGAIGRQDEIQDFYDLLRHLLGTRTPMHRQSGLHAHVTLGHDPCRFGPFKAPLEWVPNALLLIESEVGRTRHNVLGRWPLLPPRQGVLPFDDPAAAWRLAS